MSVKRGDVESKTQEMSRIYALHKYATRGVPEMLHCAAIYCDARDANIEHRNFYQMRVDRIRNMELAKRQRERLSNPSSFPAAPKGDL